MNNWFSSEAHLCMPHNPIIMSEIIQCSSLAQQRQSEVDHIGKATGFSGDLDLGAEARGLKDVMLG
jgi:hypothetical protein